MLEQKNQALVEYGDGVGRALGAKSCAAEHVGMVLSGRATAAMDDGRVIEMKAGDVFYIAPGHDSWVVGKEPYVSVHLMGADAYASAKRDESIGLPAGQPHHFCP